MKALENKRFIFIMMLFALVSWNAHADETNTSSEAQTTTEHHSSAGGLFIEPILSYSREDATIKTSQLPVISDDTSANESGGGIGARLGFHLGEVVFLAADGRYSRIHISDSSYGDADGDEYTLGPCLGIQMPVAGLRVWGTYVMAGQYDPAAGTSGFDVKFRDPRGARIGAGIHIGPVSLNVEYEDLTFDHTDVQSYGSLNVNNSTNVDFESKGYTASLSFPFEL